MEHIERAGIHSGDSISVYPAQSLTKAAKEKIAEYTRRLAKSLHVIGLINIQFIVCGEADVYVIEVNPVPAGPCLISARSPGSPSCLWPPV